MANTNTLTLTILAKNLASSVLQTVNKDLQGINKTAQNIANDSFNKMGNAFNASAGMIATGGGLIAGSLGLISAQGFALATSFESQLSSIKALTGITGQELESVKEVALKAGKETKYSALEAAQGLEELLKSGLNLDQAKTGLKGALDLAAAGGIGVADAAEIASTALNSFKKDNLSVAQASDILAGAANASATSVGELKFGLSMASAVASAVGMSFKDTNTALALFAQNGLKGSDAGTSLKTMLMNLQPSTKAQAALFDKLGLTVNGANNQFFTAEGKIKDLSQISGVLKKSLSGMTDQQRLSTMEMLFGSDAIRAANILYKEGSEGVDNMANAMSKFTASDVAKEKLNNFNGVLEAFKGSLETKQIEIFTHALGPATEAIKFLDKALNSVNVDDVIKSFQNLYNLIFKGDFTGGFFGFEEDSQVVDFLFKIRDAVMPVVDNLKILNDQFKIADGLLFGLSGTIGLLLGGGLLTLIGSIVLATYPFILFAGALTAIYIAFQNQEGIIKVVNEAWQVLLDFFNQIWKFIQDFFAPELETLQVLFDAFSQNLQTLIFWVQPFIGILYNLATQALAAVLYAFEQLRQPVNDFIQAIANVAKPIWEILVPAFVAIVGVISLVVIPAFQILWAFIVQAFKGILEVVTGTLNIIGGILNIFIGVIKGIFTGDFSQVIEGFKQIWLGLEQFFWGLIDILLSPIRGIIDGIINIFKGVDLAKMGIDMMQGLINGLWSMKDKVMEPVWNTVNSIKSAFSNIKMPNIQMPKFANGGIVPKFATGGIVGGNSNTGDRVLARVNSGEMVLNKSQQAQLFEMANGKGASTNGGNIQVNLTMNGTFLGTERDRVDFVTFMEDALVKKLKPLLTT